MKRLVIIGLLYAVAPGCADSQAGFEVATVKVAKSPGGVRGGCHGVDSKYSPTELAMAPPLGRCVITDGRLSHLINLAYNLRSTALIRSGPDWIARGDERFNVEGKADDPSKATEEQLLTMLQSLLAERFKLKFHREVTEQSGFALVVAKNGPRFKETKVLEIETHFGDSMKPMRGQPISLTVRKYTMAMLANALSNLSPYPVVDKTGLSGEYDFKLAWDESAGPSLSTAIQEQLGLRFESQKVPVSTFVIDSAQKPAEN